MDKPEALLLAEVMSLAFPGNLGIDKAAAELRRLARVEAQRDALLEKIKAVIAAEQSEGRGCGGFIKRPPTREYQRRAIQAWQELHAAIKAMEVEE